VRNAAAIGLALFAVLLAAGCSNGTPQISAPASPATPELSAAAIDYSKSLGGKSHRGETLYFVVATEDASESVVVSRLSEAEPHFGDTANYFVVLKSEWFPELAPGTFILAEAHATAAAAQEALAWWDGRDDATWYRPVVRKVTVGTASPIPVVYVDVEAP